MPELLLPSSADIFALPQEDRIQLAIDAVTKAGYKPNGGQQLSTRKAASIYQVPCSTLGNRMKGLQTRAEAHIHQQNLSPVQEGVLAKWAKVLGRRGVPLTYSTLATYASEILGKPVGESWPKRFLARHTDLKIKATTSLEKCRAKALNLANVMGLYDVLEVVVDEYAIKPKHMWNMDEKGVQLGIGVKIAAIIDRDQSTVYSVEDGNRELVTIIEAVCADGSTLIPSVIFQGVCRNLEWGRPEKNPSYASVSVSPKGWTDQELGLKWLARDFEPNTRPENPEDYRLLILDGHNSHCTYPFIKFAADHHIIIICLPSHTTHALQPCDVGVFGPLAHAWKSQVTQASQNNIAITKDNLLLYYHEARTVAFKPTTIRSAFRKTGIYPFDRHAIPLSAFEPAKNTTTQAAQPLSAELPSILVPTPDPSPAVSALTPNTTSIISAASSSTHLDPGSALPKPLQRYHIEVPLPLLHSASQHALQEENTILRDTITRATMALEQDYAQMKLMDLKNERLRQKAFGKDQRKAAKKKLVSGQARHMTAPEMIDLLARQTWESAMGDLFKEASARFKTQRKAIDDYHKGIEAEKKTAEKVQKTAAHQAKKAEMDAEKAAERVQKAASRQAKKAEIDAEKMQKVAARQARKRETDAEKAQKAAARQAKKVERDAEKARAEAERMLQGCGRAGRGRGRGRAGRGRGQGRDNSSRATAHGFDTNDSEGQVSEVDSNLTDDEDVPDADVAPQIIRPQPKPRPIRKKQMPAPSYSPGGSRLCLPEENTAAGTQTGTSALKDHPAATRSGSIQVENAGSGPSTSVLGGEQEIQSAEHDNGMRSELPLARRSRRLATKEIG